MKASRSVGVWPTLVLIHSVRTAPMALSALWLLLWQKSNAVMRFDLEYLLNRYDTLPRRNTVDKFLPSDSLSSLICSGRREPGKSKMSIWFRKSLSTHVEAGSEKVSSAMIALKNDFWSSIWSPLSNSTFAVLINSLLLTSGSAYISSKRATSSRVPCFFNTLLNSTYTLET